MFLIKETATLLSLYFFFYYYYFVVVVVCMKNCNSFAMEMNKIFYVSGRPDHWSALQTPGKISPPYFLAQLRISSDGKYKKKGI